MAVCSSTFYGVNSNFHFIIHGDTTKITVKSSTFYGVNSNSYCASSHGYWLTVLSYRGRCDKMYSHEKSLYFITAMDLVLRGL